MNYFSTPPFKRYNIKASICIVLCFLSISLQAQIQEVLRYQASDMNGDLSSSIYFSALQTDTSAYLTINNRYYWTGLALFKKSKTKSWEKGPSLNVPNMRMNISSFLVKDTLYNLLGFKPPFSGDTIGLCKYDGTSWLPASKKIANLTEFRNADIICVKDTVYIIYKIDDTNYLQKLVGMEWQTIATFTDNTYCIKTTLMMEDDTFYVATVDYNQGLTLRKINNGLTANLNFSGERVHANGDVIMKLHNGNLHVGYDRGRDIYDNEMQLWSYVNHQWSKSALRIFLSSVDLSYTYDFMYKNGDLYFIYPTYYPSGITIAGSKYLSQTNEWEYLSISASQTFEREFDLRCIRVLDDQVYFTAADDYLADEIIVYAYQELGNTIKTSRELCIGDSTILVLDNIRNGDSFEWFNGNTRLVESSYTVGVSNDTLKLYNMDTTGTFRAVITRQNLLCNMTDTTAAFNIVVHHPVIAPTIPDARLPYGYYKSFYFPLNDKIKKAQWYKDDSLFYTDTMHVKDAYVTYNIIGFSKDDVGTYKILLTDFCGNQVYTNSFKLKHLENASNFTLYPNPTKGNLSIFTDQADWIDEINIYNSTGSLVLNQKGYHHEKISLNFSSHGIYLVDLLLKDGNHIKQKLVVE